MNNKQNEKILISGSLEEKPEGEYRERGLGGTIKKSVVNAVGVQELKKNVTTFFSQLNEILVTSGDRVGSFRVEQVEISAQITGEGKVCLLGSGTKVGVGGGLKFVLKRSD
ncbi:hypothetical protein [Desulfobacula sp.]|uniref:Pepco domain-containing protein n=1 Tax=Desulfobacula sp. TaxID=2593537 RepID=UPI00261748D4|nr:hypothetical protein [Desulfobacula sp.]